MVTYISHHGVKGQSWGHRNGPPYPLSRQGSKANSEFKKEYKENQEQRIGSNSKDRSYKRTVAKRQASFKKRMFDYAKKQAGKITKAIDKNRDKEKKQSEKKSKRMEANQIVQRAKGDEVLSNTEKLSNKDLKTAYERINWQTKITQSSERSKQAEMETRRQKINDAMSAVNNVVTILNNVAITAENAGKAYNTFMKIKDKVTGRERQDRENQQTISRLRSENSVLTRRNENQQNTIRSMRETNRNQRSNIDNLNSQVNNLRNVVTNVTENSRRQRLENQRLNSQVENLRNVVINVSTENARRGVEIQRQQGQINNLRNVVSNVSSENARRGREIQRREQNPQYSEQRIQTTQALVNSLRQSTINSRTIEERNANREALNNAMEQLRKLRS